MPLGGVLVSLLVACLLSPALRAQQVASLEHDTSLGNANSLVQVDADTWALAYSGPGTGLVKTFTISADGASITEVASLVHINSTAGVRFQSLVQADADTYVLAFAALPRGGYVKTFTISADGASITEVASLQHDTEFGTYNSLVKVDADTYALAYAGPNSVSSGPTRGLLKTFTIPTDGSSITQVATLEHDTAPGTYNSLVRVDADTYALAYATSDGYLKTFTISADGASITQVTSLEHDTAIARENSLIQIDADTYALAYTGFGDDGFVKTFTIPADGASITEVAALEHDTVQGTHNSLVKVDADTYALAYAGPGDDGFVTTFTIPTNGASITEVSTLEHDTVQGTDNSLVKVDADTYALAYAGLGTDGFLKTFTILPDPIGISVGDVALAEGDADTTSFNFTVSVTSTADVGVQVVAMTANGTAFAPGDYAAVAPIQLSFAQSGPLTQTFSVQVAGETVVEGDETFGVTLSAPSLSAYVADGSGLGTITNDDTATISIDDMAQAEGDAGITGYTFTVTLDAGVQGGFTVPYATNDGSAVAPGDYTAAADTLAFAGTPGETQTLTVDVVGETVVEGDETFTVELGATSNPAVTASDASGLGTLLNDDEAPLLELTKVVAQYDPATDTVTYDVAITNVGGEPQPDDPTADELVDVLPPVLALVEASSDTPAFVVTADPGTNTVLGNGPIGVGETVTVTIDAHVIAPLGTEVINQAFVTYDADNDGTSDTTVGSDDPATAAAGDATAFVVSASILEIPTLGPAALVLLVLLFGGLGAARLR